MNEMTLQDCRDRCEAVYNEKMKHYGMSWKRMTPPAFTDRAIHLAETLYRPTTGNEHEAWYGIVNYTIMNIISRLRNPLPDTEVEGKSLYRDVAQNIAKLLDQKEESYGSCWKEMRYISCRDIAMMKLYRVRNMESTPVIHDESILDNLRDTVNYGYFGLYKLL